MYWQVALISPPYSTLTYSVPEYFPHTIWQQGLRVSVFVGKTLRPGILLEAKDHSGLERSVKDLFWPLESRPLLNSLFLQLAQDLAGRYLKTAGQVLAQVLPKNLRSMSQIFVHQEPDVKSGVSLQELQRMGREEFQQLAALWTAGRLWVHQKTGQVQEQQCLLNCDPPWPVRPNALRQQKVLDYLWQKGRASKKELQQSLGPAASCLQDLEKKELVIWQNQDEAPGDIKLDTPEPALLQPCSDQARVISELSKDLESRQCRIRLLFGVTGSGKTLVYLHLLQKCLESGRSVLILAPEVALAWQLQQEIHKELPSVQVYLYHGYQSAGYRGQTFVAVSSQKQPCVVVGTRSAVFLPRQDWGLIILDEEHDSSFKQEERLTYQAKEIAYFWARHCAALLLLGSASPDVKTFFAAEKGELGLQSLQHRVGAGRLPAVELVHLKQGQAMEGPFAAQVDAALQDCLQRGEQAIILLNKRGYAPLVYCVSCSSVVMCEHCEVGLTYHKQVQRLICHYCGLQKPFPLPCPQCGAHQYVPISEGTEQVEEYLSARLDPSTAVLRLDRDSTRRKGSMQDILQDFSSGRAQVLVGTQMCSKGHHFPQVTLVVVLDGDVGLNLPDYRATERTFQLLLQVSGRAGRGENPGRVMIQTRNPGHYCWQYVLNNDYYGFYQAELQKRRRLNYPPFSKLGLLHLSYPVHCKQGQQQLQNIGELAQARAKRYDLQVLGPAPAPLSRVRNRLRYQCLLKGQSWTAIRGLAREIMKYSDAGSSGLRISLDLDPLQML